MTKDLSKDKKRILALIIPAALPLIVCMIMTAVRGKTIFDVWAPYSGWNDEMFYFKQAQAVAKFGVPQGIWGFNESAALHGGFAAWGPLVLYPFALALKLTGGAMWAPIILNIVLLSAVLFFVAHSMGADIKKSVLLSAGLCFFIPLWRYVLSYMSEILILSLTLLFFALAFREMNEHSLINQILMSAVLIYLISLRPYFILFAAFQWYTGFVHRKRSAIFFLLSAAGGAVLYAVTGKYFKADYFGGIYVDWLGKAVTHGPRLVLLEMKGRFIRTVAQLFFDIGKTAFTKNAQSGLWIAFLVMSLLLLIEFIFLLIGIKKDKSIKNEAVMTGILLGTQILTFFAILVMYNLFAGDRHLIAFIALDTVLLVAFSKRRTINTAVILASFLLIFAIKGSAYAAPLCDRAHRAEFGELKGELKDIITLEKGTGWNNTLLVPDEDIERAPGVGYEGIELLYALPEGISVNYCEEAYVLSNFDDLKAGRMIAFEGSECDLSAKEKGLEMIGSVNGYNIYKNK